MNNYGCAVCGEYSGSSIDLVGGYTVRLCVDHINEWHVYAREHPSLVELDDIRVEFHLAAKRLEEEEMKLIFNEMRRQKKILYTVGKEWVEDTAQAWIQDHEEES